MQVALVNFVLRVLAQVRSQPHRKMYAPDLCQHPRLALWVLAQARCIRVPFFVTRAQRKARVARCYLVQRRGGRALHQHQIVQLQRPPRRVGACGGAAQGERSVNSYPPRSRRISAPQENACTWLVPTPTGQGAGAGTSQVHTFPYGAEMHRDPDASARC